MSIVIVVAFFAVFMIAGWMFTRKPATQAAQASLDLDQPMTVANGVYLADGHSAAVLQGDSLEIGADALARHIIGKVDRIDLPASKRVKKGETIAVLFGAARALRLRAPADGEIEAVNSELQTHPSQIADNWLVRMKPDQGKDSLSTMRSGDAARNWLQQEMVRLRDSLAELQSQSGLVTAMSDGGTPVAGLARQLEREQWQQLESSFFNI